MRANNVAQEQAISFIHGTHEAAFPVAVKTREGPRTTHRFSLQVWDNKIRGFIAILSGT